MSSLKRGGATTPSNGSTFKYVFTADGRFDPIFDSQATFRVVLDLLSVYFFMRYRSRPGHFFGKIGILFGALGTVGLLYLGFVKLIIHENIGGRPLLLISILFVMLAVQMITTGVMSELISRTYYESGNIKSYTIRNAHEIEAAITTDWKQPEMLPLI